MRPRKRHTSEKVEVKIWAKNVQVWEKPRNENLLKLEKMVAI